MRFSGLQIHGPPWEIGIRHQYNTWESDEVMELNWLGRTWSEEVEEEVSEFSPEQGPGGALSAPGPLGAVDRQVERRI